ncbi:uncharacterized protein PHALS_15203 [Plasmopara halstedii]|uniref:Uncharacterized protein n=1 Tax=Plasmopara halstedii TaxID=4781 RepID=A0A0P1B502_PLAHL|nr:uncharacterized protein PHALS_15203 [Plasmopara halstedii]CEG49217.1 hypothetical protein PHALS_15203 [Plasmopara halstedii]|eukprot:XP_024585586.1 hypothetical protein PHALS_15203 [Plasmopara halstedii]
MYTELLLYQEGYSIRHFHCEREDWKEYRQKRPINAHLESCYSSLYAQNLYKSFVIPSGKFMNQHSFRREEANKSGIYFFALTMVAAFTCSCWVFCHYTAVVNVIE